MSSCDFECLSMYACGQPNKLPPGAVFGPFVEVGLAGDGTQITVGNQSSPPDNHACIKSFEYGFSEGAGVKVEIYDEEGSKLSKFVNRLSKTVCNASSDYKMTVDFGWVITDCTGNVTVDKASDHGNKLYFLPLKIEVAFESGKIKYTIEGTDLQDRISETREDVARGTEDNTIDLKGAIRDMFRESCPHINDVRFEDVDGNEWNFKNSDGGPDGPRAVWNSDQQNGLATTRKWISSLMTENDKGIVFQWRPDVEEPCIVLLEDVNSAPDENDPCCKNNKGTYIVNGGNCTPVISFTPQINWTLSNGSGSGAINAGGASGNSQQAVGRENSNIERTGTAWTGATNSNENMWRPQDEIAPRSQAASAAQEAATRFREIPQAINAELKIMGDPALAFPLGGAGLVGKSVSIVVINPFYIRDCEWLAEPACNDILSNKNWMIMGVNHQIKEGSYTTTLKLFLAVPGQQDEPGTTLGGNCGSVSFDNDRSPQDDE